MSDGNCKVGAVKPTQKHLQIDDAMIGYGRCLDSLEKLIGQLRGITPDKTESCDRNEPCFIEVLETAPDRINSNNKRLEVLTEELQALLF